MTIALDRIAEHAEVVIPDTTVATREEWLEERTKGLGGSDAAAALGLSPYRTPYALWDEKTRGSISDEDNERMKWGRRLERVIIEGFSEDTGIGTQAVPMMLRSKEWPWMQVNLDGVADDGSIVEAKNTGYYMAREWMDEDGNATVPDHYGLQGQHALAVTGFDSIWFTALVGGNDARYIKVDRDEQLIETLVDMERKFWDLVESNTPPAIDGSDSTTQAIKARYAHPMVGSRIEASEEFLGWLEERASLKAQEKAIKADLAAVENKIKAAFGDYEIATVNGVDVFQWKYRTRDGYVVQPTTYRQLGNPPKGKR